MPWTPKDAEKHKKDLTDAQKKRWSKIANSVLSSCLADDGGQKECEGRAVRIANAKCKANMAFAQNQTGDVRIETIGSVEYLIAPVVSIVAGVMNDELLLPEEFGKFEGAWDGRPVVLDHPLDGDGLPISANDPQTLDGCMVGVVYNTTSNGKLKHEMWIDVERARKSTGGKELLRRLRSNVPVEVSTAYFRDLEEAPGEYEGTAYAGVARNIRPDHLAVLFDVEGACSWQDGCGVPRINQGESFEEQIRAVRDAWHAQSPPQAADVVEGAWVEEIYEDHVIVQADGKYWQVPYSEEAENITFADRTEWKRVKPSREWVPAAMMAIKKIGVELHELITHQRRNRMDEKVQMILAAEAGFTEEGLAAMEECALDAIVALLPAEEAPPETNEDDDQEDLDALIADAVEKAFANLGGLERVEAILGELQANEDQEREGLIGRLIANEQCRLTKDQFAKLDTDALRALAQTFRPADYGGQGGEPQANADDVEPFPVPAVFEREE